MKSTIVDGTAAESEEIVQAICAITCVLTTDESPEAPFGRTLMAILLETSIERIPTHELTGASVGSSGAVDLIEVPPVATLESGDLVLLSSGRYTEGW